MIRTLLYGLGPDNSKTYYGIGLYNSKICILVQIDKPQKDMGFVASKQTNMFARNFSILVVKMQTEHLKT